MWQHPPTLTLLGASAMDTYYVYAYLRQDGSPYYIGKGKRDRAWYKRKEEIKPPRNKSLILIVENNLTELGALAIERRLIRWYGRKDLGTGILRNKTDGGDGSVGHRCPEKNKKALRGRKLTETHKRNISAALIGKKRKHQQIVSQETREKISHALLGRTLSDTTKEKMRIAKIGKKFSETHKENMRRAWQDRKKCGN